MSGTVHLDILRDADHRANSGDAAGRDGFARAALEAARGGGVKSRHLYIHVPFCFHKCHYCDFYSFVDSRDRQGAFTDRLIEELRALAPFSDALETVFVGGGTPTLLAVEHWTRVLGVMRDEFAFATELEFTVECNPETATAALMRELAAGGVNRVSVGAQSFEPRHLATLERWHEPANVERALGLAAEAGIGRRSLDLIYAIPGQSVDDWKRDLARVERFVDRGLVDHASCYALTYEPNTAMTKRLERGEFEAADDEVEVAMYRETVASLGAVGLGRYEVSNFAKAGGESRHNLAYWRGRDWLAAGPSASAHVAGARWKNVPRLTTWMESVERSGGWSAVVDVEPADAERALAEKIMMGLRIAEGLDAGEIVGMARRIGRDEALLTRIAEHMESGELERREDRIVLTEAGVLFADGVAGSLMDAVAAEG